MAITKMKFVTISGTASKLDMVTMRCLQSGSFHPEVTAAERLLGSGYYRISEENPYASYLARITEAARSSGREPVYATEIVSEHRSGRLKAGFGSIDEGEIGDHLDRLPSPEELLGYIDRPAEVGGSTKAKAPVLYRLGYFEALDIETAKLWKAKYTGENAIGEFCAESAGGTAFAGDNLLEKYDRCIQKIENVISALQDGEAGLRSEPEKKAELFWDAEYDRCMKVCAKLHMLSEAFNLRLAAVRAEDRFQLFGWVPEKEADRLSDSLCRLGGVEVKFDSPEQLENLSPPTKLENSWFARPYEFFVSMFGMPRYDEIDPTPLVAITYTLFFGIMFADLGQGLVLALAGWIMGKHMKNWLGPILVRCGISGALFGLVFGSVFGYEHALDGFYRLLGFGGKPIDVMESSSITLILAAAIAIGVLLVTVVILLNIYVSLRKADYGSALFGKNGVAGLALYVGLILFALGFVTELPLPRLPLVWGMIVLPCVLIWLGEPLGRLVAHRQSWMPEKWGEYLIQGIFELFESVLSYMTNTVSFIRVGAFVLVHAGMMMVFSTIAEMAGGGVAEVIVMIFGNLLVIALEGLLVGVQSLRLEYYELFSRFFSGSGKEFKPAGKPSR